MHLTDVSQMAADSFFRILPSGWLLHVCSSIFSPPQILLHGFSSVCLLHDSISMLPLSNASSWSLLRDSCFILAPPWLVLHDYFFMSVPSWFLPLDSSPVIHPRFFLTLPPHDFSSDPCMPSTLPRGWCQFLSGAGLRSLFLEHYIVYIHIYIYIYIYVIWIIFEGWLCEGPHIKPTITMGSSASRWES